MAPTVLTAAARAVPGAAVARQIGQLATRERAGPGDALPSGGTPFGPTNLLRIRMITKLATHPSFLAVLVPIVLAASGSPARAQPAPSDSDAPEDPYDTEDDTAQDQDVTPDQAPVQPPTQAPREQPPAPPEMPPSAPLAQPAQPPPTSQPAPVQTAQPSRNGQWVHTQQYGWIWIPYGDQYVYTPQDTSGSAYPAEYVYYPSYGWTWVAAPWVWNWGPSVYFSIGRPWYFGWWHHPHFIGRGIIRHGFVRGFRAPVYGGYRGAIYRGYRGPVVRGGFRGPVIHGSVHGGFRGFSGHGFSGHVGGRHR